MSSLFQLLFPHCGVSVFLQSNYVMDAFLKAVCMCLCACMLARFGVCTCVDMHMGCVLMYAYVEACLSPFYVLRQCSSLNLELSISAGLFLLPPVPGIVPQSHKALRVSRM